MAVCVAGAAADVDVGTVGLDVADGAAIGAGDGVVATGAVPAVVDS